MWPSLIMRPRIANPADAALENFGPTNSKVNWHRCANGPDYPSVLYLEYLVVMCHLPGRCELR